MIVISLGIGRLAGHANAATPHVSVIVAARNEAENILALLEALARQDYPASRHEIIIVDDASEDDTAALATGWIKARSADRMRLLHSVGREAVTSPKKHALAQGITAASGEILLFTDADCQPPPEWISTLIAFFRPEVGMVIGYSPYELPQPRTLGERLLALESLSLASLAAGTAGWGRPATCTGRNLGYRKTLWSELGGFNAIARFISGDDDLFLKMVVQHSRWRVAYALAPQAVVPTRLLTSTGSFFRQRLRHASKGFYYGWRMTTILALAWFFNLLLLASLAGTLFGRAALWPWFCLSLKAAGELVLLLRFAQPMQRLQTLALFPLAEMLHILYLLLFGALGPLTRIRWKEKRGSARPRARE